MRFMKLFVFFLFPLFVFASLQSNRYAESFVHYFQEGNFSESLRLLDEWEFLEPEERNKIIGMRAAIFLSTGDFEKGALFMDKFAQNLSTEELSNPMINFALRLYEKAFSVSLIEPFQEIPCVCERGLPAGMQLKYGVGMGQVLVDILMLPFGVTSAHGTHGVTIVECFENCDKHREANELAKLICYTLCAFFSKK